MPPLLAEVVIVRILVSSVILLFPLLGGILAIFVDYLDYEFLKRFDPSNLDKYPYIDKFLDLYYLSLEVLVVLFWKNRLVKKTALFLFSLRIVGVTLFYLTGWARFLVFFPNVFELFFLFYLTTKRVIKREPDYKLKTLIIILLLLLIPKLAHEYLTHVNTVTPWTENEYVKLLLPF